MERCLQGCSQLALRNEGGHDTRTAAKIDMTTPIKATDFFTLWVEVCTAEHATLYRDWSDRDPFTNYVLNGTDSIMGRIEDRLHLRGYSEYERIDKAVYADHDLVPGSPAGSVWLRRIRIAFEHEHDFTSGLYKELSRLLITDCDLRVLVSYPRNVDELNRELLNLHRIVAGSDRSQSIASSDGLLFITGWCNSNGIEWWAYIYDQPAWRRL